MWLRILGKLPPGQFPRSPPPCEFTPIKYPPGILVSPNLTLDAGEFTRGELTRGKFLNTLATSLFIRMQA